MSETCDASTEIIGHKYGDDAKEASKQVGVAVKNLGVATTNFGKVNPVNLAARTGATATVDVCSTEDERQERRDAAMNSLVQTPLIGPPM